MLCMWDQNDENILLEACKYLSFSKIFRIRKSNVASSLIPFSLYFSPHLFSILFFFCSLSLFPILLLFFSVFPIPLSRTNSVQRVRKKSMLEKYEKFLRVKFIFSLFHLPISILASLSRKIMVSP